MFRVLAKDIHRLLIPMTVVIACLFILIFNSMSAFSSIAINGPITLSYFRGDYEGFISFGGPSSASATSANFTVLNDLLTQAFEDDRSVAYGESTIFHETDYVNVTYVVGNYKQQFPELDYDLPFAMLGANVGDASRSSIYIEGMNRPFVPIEGRFNANRWIHQGNAFGQADDSIYLFVSYRDYDALYGWMAASLFETLELDREQFSDAEIRDFANRANQAGLRVEPMTKSNYTRFYIVDNFILTQVTGIAFLVVILLIFYAIMRIVANHAHKMRRDYAIHMMYGATRFEVHLHSLLLHAVFIMLPALAAIREYRLRSFFESSHLITGVLVIAGLLTLGLSYYNSRIIVREAMATITSGTDAIR